MKICPRCSQENVDYATYCENCGVELPVPIDVAPIDTPAAARSADQMLYNQNPPPVSLLGPGQIRQASQITYAQPGPPVPPPSPPLPQPRIHNDHAQAAPPFSPSVIQVDQVDYRPAPQIDIKQEDRPAHPPGLMKAGSLLLVVGVIGALIGPIPHQIDMTGLNNGIGLGSWLVTSYIPTFLAMAGLLGGVLTLLRRGFYLAVPLGVLCCFAIGPYFITTIGATIATITIALNRRDFIPIIHGPPVLDKPCPVCRHPLQWVSGYREWYCFNCKNYRKLTRSHFAAAPPSYAMAPAIPSATAPSTAPSDTPTTTVSTMPPVNR